MKNQGESNLFIPPNGIICLILFLLAYPMFLLAYNAHYYPDAIATPYIGVLFITWLVALFATLWLAILTPAIVKRGAPKRASKISMAVYRCLFGFSAVLFLGQLIKQLLSM